LPNPSSKIDYLLCKCKALSSNSIPTKKKFKFCKTLSQTPYLATLNISSNPLTQKVPSLPFLIDENHKLKKGSLSQKSPSQKMVGH
jgi:hypothetical protein